MAKPRKKATKAKKTVAQTAKISPSTVADKLVTLDVAAIAQKLKAGKPLLVSERRALERWRKRQQPAKSDAERMRAMRARATDVAIPPCKNPERRARCERDLKLFCDVYLARTFPLAWSQDQIEHLGLIQQVALHGGRLASAAPRGDGKTTRSVAGATWAAFYGHASFIVLLAATAALGKKLLRDLVQLICDNDLLAEDFPEICLPIREAYGKPNRAKYITVQGKPARIDLTTTRLVLPGGMVAVGGCGILEAVRGQRHSCPDGSVIRPDLAIIDDINTRKSSASPQQNRQRLAILAGDIQRLAGPDRSLRAVACMTVIPRDDAADQLLDHKRHPEWRGTRKKLVYRWPDAEELWKRYGELLRDGALAGDAGAAATDFYKANRPAMDKGAVVGWEQRFEKVAELSAIQCAYNILLRDGSDAFAAEMQNEPLVHSSTVYEIGPQIVASKLNGLKPGEVPATATTLTAFCDVNRYGLHWSVCGWSGDMTGSVVSYGRWPQDGSPVWSEKNPRGETESQALFRNLTELAAQLTRSGAFVRAGVPCRLDSLSVDVGYLPDAVFQFLTASRLPTIVIASRGRDAKHYRQGKAVRVGDHWLVADWPNKGRVLIHDADFARMSLQQALLLPTGSPGGLTLSGEDPALHARFAEQLCSERLAEYIRGNVSDHYLWARVVGVRNDWLDATVGCRVAASYLLNLTGATAAATVATTPSAVPQTPAAPAAPRPRVSYDSSW